MYSEWADGLSRVYVEFTRINWGASQKWKYGFDKYTILTSNLYAELISWLDAQDTSSFAEQRVILADPDISSADSEYIIQAIVWNMCAV